MGSCGTAWVPCALCHAHGTAAVGSHWQLPMPVCLRLGAGLCPHLPLQTPGLWLACAHAKAPQESPGRTHCHSGTGAGSRKGTLDGSQYSSLGQCHLLAPTSTRAGLLHKLAGCCSSGTGCVWCPWVQGRGRGCSHRVLPAPGPALTRLLCHCHLGPPTQSPLLLAAPVGKGVQPGSPHCPVPAPRGAAMGTAQPRAPFFHSPTALM